MNIIDALYSVRVSSAGLLGIVSVETVVLLYIIYSCLKKKG